jgi:O-glycosyl hydrolase
MTMIERFAWTVPVFLIACSSIERSASAQSGGVVASVDPGNVYVASFEGWGTSLAWFANVTGGWSDGSRNALADLLFGPDGLRLNIVRYNIGGSSASQQGMGPGRLIRSYIDANGTYDWSVDAGQRWWLAAALARGAGIVEAFSNSPPWFMTASGDARGAVGCGDNLPAGQNNAFAEYLAEVVKHFRDSWGITFRTLEPLNEPNATWWCITGHQEGAHIGRAQQSALVQLVGEKLLAKGLTGTKVSAPDETSPGDTIGSVGAYGGAARAQLAQVNTHTYGGNSADKANVRLLAASLGTRMWMSEVDGTTGAHDHAAIAPGLWLAARIADDIRFIRPAAWIFWQAIEDEGSQAGQSKNWGLIHADMAGGSQTWSIVKKYYVMANYSRFIRPGHQIIASGDGRAVAAYSPSAGQLVVVLYNDTASDASITYDLTRFVTASGPATPYRTSATENLTRLPALAIANRQFTATAAARSVTTYVVAGVTGPAPPGPVHTLVANRNSAKVLDVSGGSTADGASVIQWTWNGGRNQEWQLQDMGGGYSRIINRQSGKCLDVSGVSTSDGAAIVQWTCGGGANQQFQRVTTGNYFQLRARHSGKCINVTGGGTGNGALLEQRTCGSGNSFQWWREAP